MLCEIVCDKFVDAGRPRGPIVFKRGLNIVLGSEHGDNSLGKSTLLLVIDFAFGGNQYAKSDDILRNVGPHEVLSAHEIDGVTHLFARSFENPDAVWVCGAGYMKQSKIGVDQFCEKLLGLYGLEKRGASFRNLVGPFLRAYGKGGDHETRPLAAVPAEKDKKAIERVLALFGKWSNLQPATTRYETAKKTKALYLNACKSELIPVAANKTQYGKNEARASELRGSLKDIENRTEAGLLDIEPEVAERMADLRIRSASLARQRGRLRTRLRLMEEDLSLSARQKTPDYAGLLKYFPDVNLRAIEEVERFHASIARVLKSEHKALGSELREQIEVLDSAIDELNKEAKELDVPRNASSAALREYARLASELESVIRANEAYDKKEELQSEEKEAKARLDELSEVAYRDIELRVNDELQRLSLYVNGPDYETPKLSIVSDSSYSLGLQNDTGAGNRVKSMVLLDLALLRLTSLPVVSEDTFSLKQVEDSSMVRYLELCEQEEKQIFVALDKAESLSEGPLVRVVEDNAVIRLAHGHELYGRAWNKRGEAERVAPDGKNGA